MPALFIPAHPEAAVVVYFARLYRTVLQINAATQSLHGGQVMAIKLLVNFATAERAVRTCLGRGE
jgi:hypothetical protein